MYTAATLWEEEIAIICFSSEDIEQISEDCWEANTKGITPTDHNSSK